MFWVPLTGSGAGRAADGDRAGNRVARPVRRRAARRTRGCLARCAALLVMDNCEHIAAAVREARGWVAGRLPTPGVLATSRTPLEVEVGAGVRRPTYESRTARRPRSKRCDRFQPGADSIQLMISPATHVGNEV